MLLHKAGRTRFCNTKQIINTIMWFLCNLLILNILPQTYKIKPFMKNLIKKG